MKQRNWITIILLCLATSLEAQTNDFFSLNDVKKYRFDQLELKNDKEIELFIKNQNQYNFIEAVKINETQLLDELLNVLSNFNDLKEINLLNYSGDFREKTFENCVSIETLHLKINEEKLSQLTFINKMNSLSSLYLYIVGRPDQLNVIRQIKPLKELHIITDLLPKDIQTLLTEVSYQPSLQTFGLSIDRITDLPANLKQLKTLSKLVLYDNLAIFANKGIEDLTEEKLKIVFSFNPDIQSAISIVYCSNNDQLVDFEQEHLKKIYNGELFGATTIENDLTEPELKNIIEFKKDFTPVFNPQKEFIIPYQSIQSESEVFVINPKENAVLYSKNGAKIVVPANAFVNPNKEDILSPVYIKISYIGQSIEQLFAGLKFQTKPFLSNRYAINIEATSEKSEALLKENYQIKLHLPISKDSAQNYFYDDESNTWQNTDFYQQVFASSFVPIDFYKIEKEQKALNYYLLDSTSFDNRFYSSKHYFLMDKDQDVQLIYKTGKFFTDIDRTWTKDYNKDGKFLGVRIKKGKNLIKIQKVIPKVRNNERFYFKLLDKSNLLVFTELTTFKKINFNVKIDPTDKRAFDREFVKNIKYFDFRLVYQLGDDFCIIKLKTSDGFKEIKAFITDTDNEKQKRKQIIAFTKSYNKYNNLLQKRSKEFEINLLKRQDEYALFLKDKNTQLNKNNQLFELKVHQLGSFGLFYSKNLEFSTNLIAQYTDERGLPIDVKYLFLIDKRYNSVIPIQVGNLNFSPTETQYIIAIDYQGNLFYATSNDLNIANLTNNSLTYIKLKQLKDNINTVELFISKTKN